MSRFKSHLALISVLLCALILSRFYFYELTLPTGDETLYVLGQFKNNLGWSPLYCFYYSILNSLTGDPILSLTLNWYVLSFILIPLLTFLSLRRFKISQEASSLAAILALLSSWNIPSEPKVQIFNYVFILIAFNIRWIKNNLLYILIFYALMTTSLFIRQDNAILVLICFFWDSLQSKNLKHILSCAGIIFIIYTGMFLFFGSPFESSRSLVVFTEHFYFNNPSLFAEDIKNNIPRIQSELNYFREAKSLKDIFLNHPEAIFLQLKTNILKAPQKLTSLFSLSINLSPPLVYGAKALLAFAIFIFFPQLTPSASIKETMKSEIGLLSISFIIKCLCMTLLLSWWSKYFFELSIIITLWGTIVLSHLKRSIKQLLRIKQSFWVYSIWPLIPICLMFYQPSKEIRSKSQSETSIIAELRKEHQRVPIKKMLSTNMYQAFLGVSTEHYNPYFDRRFDQIMQQNFNQFLTNEKIDTVIIDQNLITQSKEIGLRQIIDDFQKNYQAYGFGAILNYQDKVIVYRLLNNRS